MKLMSILVLIAIVVFQAYPQTQSKISGSKAVFKVLNVVDNYTSENQFMSPKEGQKYVAVEILLDNSKSTKAFSTPAMLIKLKDNQGQEYSIDMISAMIKPSFEGNADAGDITRGWIGYEIPEALSIDKLKIAYRGFGDKSDWIMLKKVVGSSK